jgi:hypothetical protein
LPISKTFTLEIASGFHDEWSTLTFLAAATACTSPICPKPEPPPPVFPKRGPFIVEGNYLFDVLYLMAKSRCIVFTQDISAVVLRLPSASGRGG